MTKSKNKKQKRNHNRDLTDAEIWDDSALIKSWDSAVREYELYHSIAARGEDVDEVLRRVEADDDDDGAAVAREVGRGSGAQDDQGHGSSECPEDGEIDEAEDEEGVEADFIDRTAQHVTDATSVEASITRTPGEKAQSHSQITPPATEAQDQTLENLKMAYWWAGYYSGLYEGQRQAQAQSQLVDGGEAHQAADA